MEERVSNWDGHELNGHEHLVSVFQHHESLECDACDRRPFGGGFSCSKCKFNVHGKCSFVFSIREILDHPSHDGHCLKLLTTGAPDHTDPKCHLCGKHTKRLLYHCSDCKLNLDIDCITDYMCAGANWNMSWHHHPLLPIYFMSDMTCDFCVRKVGLNDFFCPRCGLVIHESCVSVFGTPEITHLSHIRHPLKLITNGAPDYTDGRCHICRDATGKLLYHCDICKFNLDMECAIRRPPPVALSNMKVHEHTLTLMPRLISFICDACGMKGDRAPYVCVQCDFIFFHQKCARLPRVIHVNHHDHRVSFKYSLGPPGEWRCGVCWEEIDWSYGAYSCSICPRYAIHSLCATRKDVWDGEELDEVPEEVEDVEPFKRNDDNTITHFTHQHNLTSLNKGCEESSFCGACVRPIGSLYSFYKCSKSDCSFVLHDSCADLPKKKRHFLVPKMLALRQKSHTDEDSAICGACHQVFCEGFVYSSFSNFDLLCSSITVPFVHGGHDHHLLFLRLELGEVKTCQSCGIDEKEVVIGCIKCDYFLDFRCATLPLTVTLPRYDDHPLTLCYGDEETSGKYWCDICERETNPKTWFYTCKDCGVTLHVFCVVGDIRYAKPGGKVKFEVSSVVNKRLVNIECICEVLSNKSSSRPFCNTCQCRCPGSFIIRGRTNVDGFDRFFCSYYCVRPLQREFNSINKLICPPWRSKSN